MNKQAYFDKSFKLDAFTIFFDVIAILIYIVFFMYCFSLMEIPYINGAYAYWVNADLTVYDSIFGQITGGQINLILSMLVVFLVVNVPLLVINIKKQKTNNVYDVNEYAPASKFIQGMVSLFSFNPISAAIRFVNTFNLTHMTLNVGFVGAVKAIGPWFVRLFKKKSEDKIEDDDDVDTVLLKKNLKKQNIVYGIRMLLTYTLLVFVALFIL